MTFDELFNAVVRNVYPDKIPRVLVSRSRDWMRDALIDLQSKVTQLRSGNIQIVNQESTYYYCGLTVFDAPRGWISRIAITHRDVPACKQFNAVAISKEEMQSLTANCSCSTLPVPVNPSKIGPLGFMIPDPTIDTLQVITYRKASFFDGLIWFYPWINSNESIVVEWKGEKKSWDGTDLLPSSFLNEQGEVDREIQMLVELYLMANKQIFETCKPRTEAFEMYSARLARYIINRNDQDKLRIEEPWMQDCNYRSPELPTTTVQWDPPVITSADAPTWEAPVITSVDYAGVEVPVLNPPTINPNSGTFIISQLVTITTAETAPYQIRYTTNGNAPDNSSPLYTTPFYVSGTTTVKAIVTKSGYTNSPPATRTYTMVTPATMPVIFSPTDGSFITTAVVTLTTATPAPFQIMYTLDGSDPIAYGMLYSGPITLNATTTIRAIVMKPGYLTSAADEKTYTKVTATQVQPVVIYPSDPTFIGFVSVTMTCPTAGAVIYYTTNGDPPTNLSTEYTGPFSLWATATVKAIAILAPALDSNVTTKTFTLVVPQVEPVQFSPTTGYFEGSTLVALVCPTPGSAIKYTTNGSDPATFGLAYSGAITVNGAGATTVKAIATKLYYTNSVMTDEIYTKATTAPECWFLNHGPATPLPVEDDFDVNTAFLFTGVDLLIGGGGIGVFPPAYRDVLLPFTSAAPTGFQDDGGGVNLALLGPAEGFTEIDDNGNPFRYFTKDGNLFRHYCVDETDGVAYGYGLEVKF